MSDQTQNNNALIVSSSPHIRDMESIPTIMWAVVLSLIPAGIAGVFTFGFYCLYVVFLSCITAVITEVFILRLRKLPSFKRSERRQRSCHRDFIGVHTAAKCSLVYTCGGFFLCYCHCKTRFWRVGKQYLESRPGSTRFLAGSLSSRYINSDWRTLTQHGIHKLVHNITQVDAEGKLVDAITRATPLAKEAGAETYRLTHLLMGNIPGCIGETSAIALLLGDIFDLQTSHQMVCPCVLYCYSFHYGINITSTGRNAVD